VSSSQRILSLWLERLSTDRIARQWHEAPSPLVVFGKRGNLDLVLALDAAAEWLRLAVGPAPAPGRALHPNLPAAPRDRRARAPPPRRHCRRLPALHATRRRRSPRRHPARHRRLRASFRRRGEAARRCPGADDALRLFRARRRCRYHWRSLRGGALR